MKVWISGILGKSEALATLDGHFTQALRNLWLLPSLLLATSSTWPRRTPKCLPQAPFSPFPKCSKLPGNDCGPDICAGPHPPVAP